MYCINYNFNYHQFCEYQGLYHGDVKAVQCRIIIKVMKGKFEEYWILIKYFHSLYFQQDLIFIFKAQLYLYQ